MNKVQKLKALRVINRVTRDQAVVRSILDRIETTGVDVYEAVGPYIMGRTELTDVGFDSPCFKKYSNDETEYINLMDNPDVEEGMFQCSRCKSKRVWTMSKQTRAGDEATTVFARCSECKKEWVAN